MLEALDKSMKSAKKCTARQKYLKLLIEPWKASCGGAATRDYAIRRACFRHHNEAFRHLQPQDVAALRQRASAHKRGKVGELLAERQYWQGQLELLHRRR